MQFIILQEQLLGFSQTNIIPILSYGGDMEVVFSTFSWLHRILGGIGNCISSAIFPSIEDYDPSG